METEMRHVKAEDLTQLKRDVELIKNILASEGELTDWARSELAEARQVPESEYVSHEDVEDMILRK